MKILIAGLGLIGGSFALALRDRGIADEILGVEKSDENAAEALRLGLADRIVTLEEGVPALILRRMALISPCSCIFFASAKVLPPPTHMASASRIMRAGSLARWTERTRMPSSEKRACTFFSYSAYEKVTAA